jgi:hypothetical protein
MDNCLLESPPVTLGASLHRILRMEGLWVTREDTLVDPLVDPDEVVSLVTETSH